MPIVEFFFSFEMLYRTWPVSNTFQSIVAFSDINLFGNNSFYLKVENIKKGQTPNLIKYSVAQL